MTLGYVVMKIVHLLATVVFLGTIFASVFWKMQADRTRDGAIIAHTLRAIRRADRIFTMPASILLLIAGFGAQGMGHYPLTLPWILWGIILYVLASLVYMLRVAPIQRRLVHLATSTDFDWTEYERTSRQWDRWGMLALLLPLAAFVLMVWKPA